MVQSKSEIQKKYIENNREKWRQSVYKYLKKPYICKCGAIMTNGNKSYHMKSKKHFDNLEILKNMI